MKNEMKIKKVKFQGWDNCIELTHGKFKLIVTTEVGPRIIGGFLEDGENIFMVDPKLAGKTGGDKWVNYGGHRFWHSPEDPVRTYAPDNEQISVYEMEDGSVSFVSEPEELTHISKTINIHPEGENSFRIEHILRNDGLWDVECAGWALSVMDVGGVAVVPQNPGDPNALLPTKFVSVWPYASMTDPRVFWGDDLVMLRQDPNAKTPFKIGINCQQGWCAYLNKGVAFVKQFNYYDDEEYPDNNCSVELYTCKTFLELETLGPLAVLEPGDELIHEELWTAVKVDLPKNPTEEDVKKALGLDEDSEECDCGCEEHDDACKTEKKSAKSAKKAEPAKKASAAKKAEPAKKAEAKKSASAKKSATKKSAK